MDKDELRHEIECLYQTIRDLEDQAINIKQAIADSRKQLVELEAQYDALEEE